jgi:hypothetical protein
LSSLWGHRANEGREWRREWRGWRWGCLHRLRLWEGDIWYNWLFLWELLNWLYSSRYNWLYSSRYNWLYNSLYNWLLLWLLLWLLNRQFIL